MYTDWPDELVPKTPLNVTVYVFGATTRSSQEGDPAVLLLAENE
jgi:hypothetical protein